MKWIWKRLIPLRTFRRLIGMSMKSQSGFLSDKLWKNFISWFFIFFLRLFECEIKIRSCCVGKAQIFHGGGFAIFFTLVARMKIFLSTFQSVIVNCVIEGKKQVVLLAQLIRAPTDLCFVILLVWKYREKNIALGKCQSFSRKKSQ